MGEIPSSTAKDELVKINKILTTPHLLIGGLAVQQYYPARDSSDIDIICADKIAKDIIEQLYPTKDFTIDETNQDDFRPAYIITSKVKEEKVIFIGPKITEREAYKFLDWKNIEKNSQAFEYKKNKLENIRVPQIEVLAFTKLLAFINRTSDNQQKGERDLIDFINLSNDENFSINALIDLIRRSSAEEFIIHGLDRLYDKYDATLWEKSLFVDLLKLIKPALEASVSQPREEIFDDNYEYIYHTDKSIEFYDIIASQYDERNSNILYNGHQAIIGYIRSFLPNGGKVLDLGSGTGRLIASHFMHNKHYFWHAIDGSEKMLNYFLKHMEKSSMHIETLRKDIRELDWSTLEQYDLGMACFTLSSLPSIDACLDNLADKIKDNGYLLISDIHPARTIISPYYDFSISDNKTIALKPYPIFPDKLIEKLLEKNFNLIRQETINDNSSREYAFISVFKKGK